jgi:hypothetical protein
LKRAHSRLAVVISLTLAISSGCAKEDSAEQAGQRQQHVAFDASRATPGSPEHAVLQFIRYVQLDVIPIAIRQYDAAVVARLGVAQVTGALGSQTAALRTARLMRIRAERTELGRLVVLELSIGDRAQTYSFLLRRSGKLWKIRYDTFLKGALAFYVQRQVEQQERNGRSPLEAAQAGLRAASRYEALALLEGGPSRSRRPRR